MAEVVLFHHVQLHGMDQHLFTESSLPSYDEKAAALVVQRSQALLDRVG